MAGEFPDRGRWRWLRLAWLAAVAALMAGLVAGEARARRVVEADPFAPNWRTPARPRPELRPARPPPPSPLRRRPPAPSAWPVPADERVTRLA